MPNVYEHYHSTIGMNFMAAGFLCTLPNRWPGTTKGRPARAEMSEVVWVLKTSKHRNLISKQQFSWLIPIQPTT